MDNPGKHKKAQRYVVIHGHFYQPPRENPWIEEVERQESAAPYHDWNEFITYQCYMPNMMSKVMDKARITDLVNNFAQISFNIGPTLMSYLEKHFSDVHDGIREGDRVSMRHNNGHGNAIAQAYNHMILPLANDRDKHTQVIWGIRDFEHRFRRSPEAIWLPETACDYATLRVLMDYNMRYVILAPNQAQKVRPLNGNDWQDVSNGSIDPRKPYRHYEVDADGKRIGERFIDIFFYDGGLSRDIAFTAITTNAAACADRVLHAFGSSNPNARLVSVATDGETFGHHHQFSEMCLAYLTRYELPQRNVQVLNYGHYLDLCPPQDEVMIKGGEGTAWSCAHGVGRWKEDCGCTTGRGEFHQRWRAPLRHAYLQLRDSLAEVFDNQGKAIFHNQWDARNEYIHVILDRDDSNVISWLNEHLKVKLTPETKTHALQLLEMQRHAMLMFTSCGWFFDELSRIETVQCMFYAARAAQLAKQVTGQDFEARLKKDLEAAPSNIQDFRNGKVIYERFVEPARVDWKKVIAQHAIRQAMIPDAPTPETIYDFSLHDHTVKWEKFDGWLCGVGHSSYTNRITSEYHEGQFFCLHLGDEQVLCFVGEYENEDAFNRMADTIFGNLDKLIEIGLQNIAGPFFDTTAYSLEDMFRADRENIITTLMRERVETLKSYFQRVYLDNLSLMERYRELGWNIPPELRIPSQYAVVEELVDRLRATEQDYNFKRVHDMKDTLDICSRLGLELKLSVPAHILENMIRHVLKSLVHHVHVEQAAILKELADVAAELNLIPEMNSVIYLMGRLLDKVELASDETEEHTAPSEAVTLIRDAVETMGFNTENWRQLSSAKQQEAVLVG